MSDLVVARNCCITRMLPGEAELVSLYKNVPFFFNSVANNSRNDTAAETTGISFPEVQFLTGSFSKINVFNLPGTNILIMPGGGRPFKDDPTSYKRTGIPW